MSREIALISENPQAHQVLIRQLAASGFRVLPCRSIAAVLPRLQSCELGHGGDSIETTEPGSRRNSEATSSADGAGPAALILDSPNAQDLGLLSALAQRHPGLPQLVFDWDRRWPLLPFQKSACQQVFRQPLTDPDSLRIIQEAIGFQVATKEDGRVRVETGTRSADVNAIATGLDPRSTIVPEATTSASSTVTIDSSRVPKLLRWQVGQNGQSKKAPLYSEDFLRRVGLANVPVLLHGETGVGKEVMARRLWSYSARAGKPFLKLNCAALPSELIESELFGYEKGAFTGAAVDKPGKFELAQNGTMLLDEIGDMDVRLQAKLLQVLQDGEVQPLGSSRILNVNVRIMAATHRDLRVAIQQGSFREDLYYRLSVINLSIPPLRHRRSEILSLAEGLLERHLPEGEETPLITDSLRRAMLNYPWPGNVRELENVMRRLIVYRDADLLAEELTEISSFEIVGQAGMKSKEMVARTASSGKPAPAPAGQEDRNEDFEIDRLARASREAESKLLLETLEEVRWNRRQAAAKLNVDYKAFLYKLQKHGIVEGKAKRRDESV